MGSDFGAVMAPEVTLGDELRDLIRAAIEEAAARGRVVIVSHAASHALASQPGVLRVLITASPQTRCARVAAEGDLNEKDAARAVDQSDTARADYLKRFYGANVSYQPSTISSSTWTGWRSPGRRTRYICRRSLTGDSKLPNS